MNRKRKILQYDKATHIQELEAAGVPTRLFTAESDDELMNIINAEVELMENDPLTEDGRRMLKYWLDNAGVVAGAVSGPPQQARHLPAEMYQGLYLNQQWRTEFRQTVLSALYHVLSFHVRLYPEMLDPISLLVSPDGTGEAFRTEPEGCNTWWQTRLQQCQDGQILVKSGNKKNPILRTVTTCHETAKHLFSLLNPPATASQTRHQLDGWTVGKLSVIKWGASLKYPIDGAMETFNIQGDKQWEDINVLMKADGKYFNVGKGFRQRWQRGDAGRLRKIAFEAESKRGQKGNGCYRLIK